MAKKIFNFGERLALYSDLPANPVELITVPGTILNIVPGMTSAQIIECLGGQSNIDKLFDACQNGKPIFGTALQSRSGFDDYLQIPIAVRMTEGTDNFTFYFNAFVSGETWDMTLYYNSEDWSVIGVTTTPLNPQYDTMPTASASTVDKIVQYTGTTDSTYTNGYFYKCVSDGAQEPTYSWENTNVQSSDDTELSLLGSYNVFDFVGKKGIYMSNPVQDTMNTFTYKNSVNGSGTTTVYGSVLLLMVKEKVEEITDNYSKPFAIAIMIQDGRLINFAFRHNTDGTISTNKSYIPSNNYFLTTVAQTINGTKTFGSIPEVSSYTAPTTDTQLVAKKYVDDLIAGLDITKREIVQTLPTQNISTKTIYMVPKSTPGTQNIYDEYMYITNAWEKIGDTEIDLSNYYTKTEVDAMITNLNNQIGNIAEVLSHLTNPVIPIGTVLYTEDVSRTVGNVTYEGTYTATVKEFHADTNYYVIDYTFENTGSDDIPGAVFDEITVNPAGHLPLMAAYTIEAGETVTLTSYWQDSATYAATEARYQVPGNVSVEFDTTDNTNNYTSNLALNKLDGFNTDVVAHVHTYDSSEIDEGWTHTTFDRTGGTEDPYTVPEPFYVAWINFDTQTFGVLSEPISDTLTMTRSYIGFNADQFDQNNVAFFLAKTADVADCTWQEFEDAYYDYTGGVN